MKFLRLTLPKIVQKSSDAAMEKTLDDMVQEAQRLCPVGTPRSTGIPGYIGGSLKKTIRKEKVAKVRGIISNYRFRAGGIVTNPNTNKKVDYDVYVERGTRYMKARPYMRPAAKKSANFPGHFRREWRKRRPKN